MEFPYRGLDRGDFINAAPYNGNRRRPRATRAFRANIARFFPVVNEYPLQGTDWQSREFEFRGLPTQNADYFRHAFQFLASFLLPGEQMRVYVMLPDGTERALGPPDANRNYAATITTYDEVIADQANNQIGLTLMGRFVSLIYATLDSNAEVILTQLRVRQDIRRIGDRGGATDASDLPGYLCGDNGRIYGGITPVPRAPGHLCAFKALALLLFTNPAFPVRIRIHRHGAADPPANYPRRRTRILKQWKVHAQAIVRWLDIPMARAEASGFSWPEDAWRLVERVPEFRVVRMPVSGNFVAPDAVVTGNAFRLEQDPETGRFRDAYTVYLLWDVHQQHYHAITAIQEWVGRYVNNYNSVWCEGCFQMVPRERHRSNNILTHECRVLKCNRCGTVFNSELALAEHTAYAFDRDNPDRRCTQCNDSGFPNDACLAFHRGLCSGKMQVCSQCQRSVPSYRLPTHVCEAITCKNCKTEYVPNRNTPHRCYIQAEKRNTDWPADDLTAQHDHIHAAGRHFYFFDFESQFVGEAQRHEVIFAAVKRAFAPDEPMVTFNTMAAFMTWTMHPDRAQHNATFIAHNLKGYDGRLIFDYVKNELKQIPEPVLWNGQKIMRMVIGGIGNSNNGKVTFQDSLLHVTAKLEAFPKIFGLDTTRYAKDFFPYKFATPEHRDYVGPPPQRSFFEPNRMSRSKRRDFLQWYEDEWHPPRLYDFRAELERYCRQDVDILCRSMEVYMTQGMLMNEGLNPLRCTTCASYALRVYRALFMPKDSIAVLTKAEAAFVRRGLRGGRTDVRCMLKHISRDEMAAGVKGAYLDVQSLYPACQKYDPMPSSIPVWEEYLAADGVRPLQPQPTRAQLESFYGFLEVDIHPERYQHHPAIVAYNPELGKLVGDLLPKERIVLYSEELKAALRQGYQVDKVYATLAFVPRTDLFSAYVSHYLKLKILASGMPRWIKTDADFADFQQQLAQRLDIHVERAAFSKNDGAKAIAKLMLNSLWGKFAQRTCYQEHQSFDGAAYQGILQEEMEGTRVVHYREFVGDRVLVLSTRPTKEKQALMTTNVAMAAATSASGRLRLLAELEKLGPRVLYHDTDSIIYTHDPNAYNIPQGRYVGEWEAEEDGKPITSFVGMAPKSYAYTFLDETLTVPRAEQDTEAFGDRCMAWLKEGRTYEIEGDQVLLYGSRCKCKGFTLNHENTTKIHFDAMVEMVLGEISEIKTVNMKFAYNRRKGGIYTTEEEKFLRVMYNKGFINDAHEVLPFGHDAFQHARSRVPKRIRTRG